MTWEEYYDKFYDWSENTQVNKLSSVESLGPADEVVEVMMEKPIIGGKNLSYCKSRPLTNKKANIKTHKYGVAILMYGLRFFVVGGESSANML